MKSKQSLIDRLRKHNKLGFSLVELIVVVAIMAVLVAVLAPSLLAYVERTRSQKDTSAMSEVSNAIMLALANPEVYDEVENLVESNNVSCFIDANAESDAKSAPVDLNSDGSQYTFGDASRVKEQEIHYAAGNMKGVTITFKPTVDGDKATYVLEDAVINKFVGNDGVELKDCPKLYNAVRSAVGNSVEQVSRTYRYSEYTIFIKLSFMSGYDESARDAVQVYGQYNGVNLPKGDNSAAKIASSDIRSGSNGDGTNTGNGDSSGGNNQDDNNQGGNSQGGSNEDINNGGSENGDAGNDNAGSGSGSGNNNQPTVDPALNHSGTIPEGAMYTRYINFTIDGFSGWTYDEKITYKPGDPFPTEVLPGDMYEYSSYKYCYGWEWDPLSDWPYIEMNNGGWTVRCIGSGSVPPAILESVNNQPITSLHATFFNSGITTTPAIPNSVTDMSLTFLYCGSLTTAQAIPSWVTNASGTFEGCANLKKIQLPCSLLSKNYSYYNCPARITYYHVDGCAGTCGYTDSPVHDGTIPAGGTYYSYNGSTYVFGNSFPVLSNNDVYEYGDYKYTYVSSSNGWKVEIDTDVTDKRQTSYGEILESINSRLVVDMTNTFSSCQNMTTAPVIPSGVTNLREAFSYCTSLTTAPKIPSGVENMYSTFNGCAALTSAPDMRNVTNVTNLTATFANCTSLTTAPDLSNCTKVTGLVKTFKGCSKLSGTISVPCSVSELTWDGCSATGVQTHFTGCGH